MKTTIALALVAIALAPSVVSAFERRNFQPGDLVGSHDLPEYRVVEISLSGELTVMPVKARYDSALHRLDFVDSGSSMRSADLSLRRMNPARDLVGRNCGEVFDSVRPFNACSGDRVYVGSNMIAPETIVTIFENGALATIDATDSLTLGRDSYSPAGIVERQPITDRHDPLPLETAADAGAGQQRAGGAR